MRLRIVSFDDIINDGKYDVLLVIDNIPDLDEMNEGELVSQVAAPPRY